MTFRYTRHTTDLLKMEKFYTEIVGLEKLGGSQKNDNYEELLLGCPNLSWQLAFTTSNEKPLNKFDQHDMLIFYLNTEIELTEIKKTIEISPQMDWSKNDIMISDPDGYNIMFSIRHIAFKANDFLTNLVREKGVNNWSELIEWIRNLPYGRNQNRQDFSLVLTENKGTCSSKHSFLKKIAELNQIENVKLMLGIYKMNHLNTPKIGGIISENGLAYIPEAHCYLKLNNKRVDLTTSTANIEHIRNDILEEIEIKPEQVNTFKIEFHKNYLEKWICENAIEMDFDKIWEIREKCIKQLEE